MSQGSPNAQLTQPCRAVTASDLATVGSVQPAHEEQLANAPGSHLSCSTLFIDSAGGLILEVTQAPGGPRELSSERLAARSAGGAPHSVAHLPAGFIAGTELAFLHRGQLVTLKTGYSTSGQLQLTSGQLERLGVIAEGRLG